MPARARILLACLAAALAVPVATQAASWTSTPAAAAFQVSSGTLPTPAGVDAHCYTALSNHVTVTWTASGSSLVGGYAIQRASSSTGPFSTIGTVTGAATTSYTDATTALAATYYYRVLSTRSLWTSPASASVGVLVLAVLCL